MNLISKVKRLVISQVSALEFRLYFRGNFLQFISGLCLLYPAQILAALSRHTNLSHTLTGNMAGYQTIGDECKVDPFSIRSDAE